MDKMEERSWLSWVVLLKRVEEEIRKGGWLGS